MQSSEEAQPVLVEVVELKKLARAKLPDTSALRDPILSEGDYLPQDEAVIKAKLCSRLLHREVGKTAPTNP